MNISVSSECTKIKLLGGLTCTEPTCLTLDQTGRDFCFIFCVFLEQPLPCRENPSSAHAQSTSGLSSQTSHHYCCREQSGSCRRLSSSIRRSARVREPKPLICSILRWFKSQNILMITKPASFWPNRAHNSWENAAISQQDISCSGGSEQSCWIDLSYMCVSLSEQLLDM